jgi:hypothetical protein
VRIHSVLVGVLLLAATATAADPPLPQLRRLMAYLAAHREELAPELRALWLAAGGKASGTWSDVFGPGPAGEEVFMAWHFARYAEAVAAAGKREYPLPMFVNAALIRPGHQPGQYPSAGPLPHLRVGHGGPASGDPERRRRALRRRALGERPPPERRRDAPGTPRAARAGAFLDAEGEALPLLG